MMDALGGFRGFVGRAFWDIMGLLFAPLVFWATPELSMRPKNWKMEERGVDTFFRIRPTQQHDNMCTNRKENDTGGRIRFSFEEGGRRALSLLLLLLLPTLNTERLNMYPLSSPLVFLLLSLLSQGFLLLLLLVLFLLLRALKSNPILEAEVASLPKSFLLTPPFSQIRKFVFLYIRIFFSFIHFFEK